MYLMDGIEDLWRFMEIELHTNVLFKVMPQPMLGWIA